MISRRLVPVNGYFLGHPATGSGQYTEHLLDAVVGSANDVRTVAVTDRRTVHRHAPVTIPPMLSMRDPFAKIVWEQVGFPDASRRLDASVMHVPYFAPPVRRVGVPVVVTIHDLIPLVMPAYASTPMVRLYNRLVAFGARRAELILADSEASRRDIIQILGIAPTRVRTVYLGVKSSLGIPVSAGHRQAVRSRYGLPDRFLLYLGGFDIRKNVVGLIDAVAALDPGLGVHLVVAGRLPGPDRRRTLFPDVEARARERNITDRVRFPGFIDEADKGALMQLATAFVFPSRYEGFGLDPLEALMAGTPVISSDRTSLPELMGDAAILIDPDAPGALTNAIDRVWRDSALQNDLASRGPVQASRFTWEACAQQTVAAWNMVARPATM